MLICLNTEALVAMQVLKAVRTILHDRFTTLL